MRRVSQNKKKTITFVRSFPALLKGMFFSNTFDEALFGRLCKDNERASLVVVVRIA
jgi:hypothetical protein